jgi:protein melted
MEQTLPIAVKFLNKENKEMSRNLASYLSLAAIEYTDLLVPHIDIILRSLIHGNYSMSRVVLQLYEISNEPAIIVRTGSIIDILSKCEELDKNILLQLIENIIGSCNDYNNLVIDKLPQFFDLILTSSTAIQTLSVLLKVARKKPSAFNEYVGLLILTAQKNPSTIPFVGQLLAAIGMKNKEKAYIALEFIMENLPQADRPSQTTLLQEAVKLCSQYPILFNDKLTAVIRQRNLSNNSIHNSTPQLTSGNVTIVNLNSSRSYHNTQQQLPSNNNSSIPIIPQPMVTANSTTIRRNKFDSRSTNRLHSAGSNNITLSHANNLSCIRLSSSQHIHQLPSRNSSTIPPPLSSNVSKLEVTQSKAY